MKPYPRYFGEFKSRHDILTRMTHWDVPTDSAILFASAIHDHHTRTTAALIIFTSPTKPDTNRHHTYINEGTMWHPIHATRSLLRAWLRNKFFRRETGVTPDSLPALRRIAAQRGPNNGCGPRWPTQTLRGTAFTSAHR